jgi:LmbE family N-acetylglucosaminyl deacetylase
MISRGQHVVLAVAHHDGTRRNEAEAGAAILGCDIWFREKGEDLAEWSAGCLHKAKPVVIATHPIGDPHFEHEELGEVIKRVLTKSKVRKDYPLRWYCFDTYYSTSTFGPPVLIDISGHFQQKCMALKCHCSQNPEGLVEMARTTNSLNGQRIRVEYAEAFFIFPLLGRWPTLRDLP